MPITGGVHQDWVTAEHENKGCERFLTHLDVGAGVKMNSHTD